MKKILSLLCASVILNILCLPIAAPIMFENAKQATADKLMQLAGELKPSAEIPKVQREIVVEGATIKYEVNLGSDMTYADLKVLDVQGWTLAEEDKDMIEDHITDTLFAEGYTHDDN